MEKHILVRASYCNQKYYFNPEYDTLPDDIKKEIKVICICTAENVRGAFSIGFYENSDIFLETSEESDLSFDDIGAGLEIKDIQIQCKELLNKLSIWYKLFKTEQGKAIRDTL